MSRRTIEASIFGAIESALFPKSPQLSPSDLSAALRRASSPSPLAPRKTMMKSTLHLSNSVSVTIPIELTGYLWGKRLIAPVDAQTSTAVMPTDYTLVSAATWDSEDVASLFLQTVPLSA